MGKGMTAAEAQRKVDAIDKRIDLVRAELIRATGFDPAAHDYTDHAGSLAACIAWQRAWDSVPGLQGIEASLYCRRYDARMAFEKISARDAAAARRRELREIRHRATCPTCGQMVAA